MNHPLSHPLLTMAYQNAWANHRLGQLSPDDLAEFFCAGESALRAADVAEPGWTEALIWDR